MPGQASHWLLIAGRACNRLSIISWPNIWDMNRACTTLHFMHGAEKPCRQKSLLPNDKCPGLQTQGIFYEIKVFLKEVPQKLVVNVVVVLDLWGFYKSSQQARTAIG